jgi:ketosteroid isomerase-like protein
MASANLDLVRSIYANWERGDFTSTEWADPEIELVIADGVETGIYHGLDGMITGWRGWLSAFDSYRVEVDEYRDLGNDHVLVFMKHCGRGKRSGLAAEDLRRDGANVLRIRDGRVVSITLYWDRARALADLGLARLARLPDS